MKDKIYNISPIESPLLAYCQNSAEKTVMRFADSKDVEQGLKRIRLKAEKKQPYHEWITEELTAIN